MLTGALHIHSTWSDGELTLAALREALLAAGCAFACLTDHAEFFDAGRLTRYVREAEALSDDRFRFVPGLEFGRPGRMHVLGFGVTVLAAADDPQAVIRHIRAAGGVSVIAHPPEAAFAAIGAMAELPDGIEAWNSKYDGRYAPRPATFALIERLRVRRPALRAFYGQDLHWRTQYRGLVVAVGAPRADGDAILAALAAGEFCGRREGLVLPSDGRLPADLLARFGAAQRRCTRLRGVLTGAHALARRLGARVPAPLKAQVRRLL
jgi:hypothetical protein